jgi:hypothetical protein
LQKLLKHSEIVSAYNGRYIAPFMDDYNNYIKGLNLIIDNLKEIELDPQSYIDGSGAISPRHRRLAQEYYNKYDYTQAIREALSDSFRNYGPLKETVEKSLKALISRSIHVLKVKNVVSPEKIKSYEEVFEQQRSIPHNWVELMKTANALSLEFKDNVRTFRLKRIFDHTALLNQPNQVPVSPKRTQ